MKKIVCLDLEETIIVSWHSPVPCNTPRIKALLQEHQPEELIVFSFAIDNQKDINRFNKFLKEWLESLLGFKFTRVPSSQEIMQICFNHTGNHFELFEFKSVWGKMRAFHDFCNASFQDAECILIDDVVQNTTFINHDKNLVLKTIKV